FGLEEVCGFHATTLHRPSQTENTAGAARMRFRRNLDLRNSGTVIATDAEHVLAGLERPIVAPYHPRQIGKRCPQPGRPRAALITLDFDAGKAACTGVRDPANGHQPLAVLFDDGLRRDRIDD